jgi:hypothetical protein
LRLVGLRDSCGFDREQSLKFNLRLYKLITIIRYNIYIIKLGICGTVVYIVGGLAALFSANIYDPID